MCGCAGSSFQVKIETDSDSNDITEYSHGYLPSTGMFGFMMIDC